MNARLRRLLQPKNAIMVLNEMSETVKFTFHEPLNPASTLFAVSVEVLMLPFNTIFKKSFDHNK